MHQSLQWWSEKEKELLPLVCKDIAKSAGVVSDISKPTKEKESHLSSLSKDVASNAVATTDVLDPSKPTGEKENEMQLSIHMASDGDRKIGQVQGMIAEHQDNL
jgi:hypothetical protein